MTDKRSNNGRRKLLKSIAAGSGAVVAGKCLPEGWTRPVINSVMLPAHASTTNDTDSGGTDTTTTEAPLPTSYNDTLVFNAIEGRINHLEDVLSVFVQDALAKYAPPSGGSMCVDTSNAPDFIATVLIKDEQLSGYFKGTGTIGSSNPTLLTHMGGCDIYGTVEIMVTSYDANGAVYTVYTDSGNYVAPGTAPAGTTCPQIPVDCAASDIRLKTNIEAISTSREGFDLYKFQYLSDVNENTYVGVMAQDVISRHPEAIVQNEFGFYMVRYDLLGLKMVTLDKWELEGPDSVELIN